MWLDAEGTAYGILSNGINALAFIVAFDDFIGFVDDVVDLLDCEETSIIKRSSNGALLS